MRPVSKRPRRCRSSALRLTLGVGALLVAGPSAAAGPAWPRGDEAQAPLWTDWSGPYFGAQGSAGGLFGKGYFDRVAIGSQAFGPISSGTGKGRPDTPVMFGAHAGYNWRTGPFVFGLEADAGAFRSKRTIPEQRFLGDGFLGADEETSDPAFDLLRVKNDRLGSVRVRGGFAYGPYLFYATAGLVAADARLFAAFPVGVGEPRPWSEVGGAEEAAAEGDAGAGRGAALESAAAQRFAIGRNGAVLTGYTVGVGIEMAVAPQASLGVEYRYSDFGSRSFYLGSGRDTPATARLNFSSHQTMARLTWHPQGLKLAPEGDDADDAARKDWSIHGQTTFFQQGVGGFRSPYIGPNSLIPHQARETWTITGFLGRRLWEGAEVYYNPEWAEGFGLGNTLGLGGYVNGEAQKAGAVYPFYRSQRYFFRQTIGLGGEQEQVKDGPNQMAGSRDVDRITVTVGKFAVGDIFDDNAYAHDPRATFNNWALWASGAYDFPANLPGFTRGAVIDLNRKDWALRAGYFQVPKQPNNDVLDPRVGDKRGIVVELETRHTLFDQPGKLRFGAFLNRGRTGNYREAIFRTFAEPESDPTDQIEAIRRGRNKVGFYVNGEQALTETVGVFGRVSWNDGRNEILSFTDIDASVSGGVSIKGAAWGRPDDVWGVGAATSGLSRPHREFLAIGGTGLLIGDGRLTYSPERVFETYYAFRPTRFVTVSLDYQMIANPAYNRDRGPASFAGLRMHAEF